MLKKKKDIPGPPATHPGVTVWEIHATLSFSLCNESPDPNN